MFSIKLMKCLQILGVMETGVQPQSGGLQIELQFKAANILPARTLVAMSNAIDGAKFK